MSENPSNMWRRCSNCKAPIALGATYYACSVSTCNRKRTGLVFCSVSCWDAHLPIMKHKDAWAEDRRAPSEARQHVMEASPASRGQPSPSPRRADDLQPPPADEILVVASKVKAYVKARADLSTSAGVMTVLSEHIRRLCDEAIRSAREHERKTVLERDIAEP